MLPEWAGRTQIGRCQILYGGFNPHWTAGGLERATVDLLAHRLNELYPNNTTAVVVPSWYESQAVVDYINQFAPSLTVLCSLTDPMGDIEHRQDQFHGRVCTFGYVTEGIKYDFWADACLKHFKEYSREDVLPDRVDYLYLNYNRKPHHHRLQLVEQLKINDLIDLGCVTLAGQYSVGDAIDDYKDFGAYDVGGELEIPNDVYSLGQIDLWRRSFINIVSETQFNGSHVFLSEKIFKPIVGLRPFIINGDYRIYSWLEQAGFDCFADIFPVDKIKESNTIQEHHKLIIDTLLEFKDQNWSDLYQTLLPRLIKNEKHFRDYARNQSHITKFSAY